MEIEDSIPPDPEGKAATLLAEGPAAPRRGRGRPKGSGKRATQAPPPEVELGPPTEAEIQAMTVLGMVVWSLVAVRIGGLSELEDEERRQLGMAMVPVFRKYASILGGYEAEFGLLVVAGGLVLAHWPKPPSQAEVVEEEQPPKKRERSWIGDLKSDH